MLCFSNTSICVIIKIGDIMFEFINNSLTIFNTLENNGFQCYAVGGCVRDCLLGLAPKDVDFTTDATPDEIIRVFSDYKTLDIGKKYGTVGVITGGNIYEITTFRVDGAYADNRHPEEITFSKSLQEDLSRRDFTINAMAMNKTGEIFDPFGGKEDLKNKVIRTVGVPTERFSEDALRIVRALRFASKLGFYIESDTESACFAMKHLLKNVHPQRIRTELENILLSKYASEIIYEYREVFGVIIPELRESFDFSQVTPHHKYDVFTHTVKALEITDANLAVRLALLFHDIGKPQCCRKDTDGRTHFKGHPAVSAELAEKIMMRFNFSGATTKLVKKLIYHHDDRFHNLKPDIRRLFSEFNYEEFLLLSEIQRCDTLAQSEYKREEKLLRLSIVKETAKYIYENENCFNVKDLKVNGEDIKALGANGKEIGDCLNFLLSLVIDGHTENNRSRLLSEAEKYLKNNN